jgi:hypothetical protein
VQSETYTVGVFKAQAMKEARRDEVEELEIIGLNFDVVRIAGVWQADDERSVIGEIVYDKVLIDKLGLWAISVFILEKLLNILKAQEFSRYYKLKSRRKREKDRKNRQSL